MGGDRTGPPAGFVPSPGDAVDGITAGTRRSVRNRRDAKNGIDGGGASGIGSGNPDDRRDAKNGIAGGAGKSSGLRLAHDPRPA
jgi:hypothetical protein